MFFRACSSVGRAHGLQPWGQGFEPPQVHQHFSIRPSHLQALLFGGRPPCCAVRLLVRARYFNMWRQDWEEDGVIAGVRAASAAGNRGEATSSESPLPVPVLDGETTRTRANMLPNGVLNRWQLEDQVQRSWTYLVRCLRALVRKRSNALSISSPRPRRGSCAPKRWTGHWRRRWLATRLRATRLKPKQRTRIRSGRENPPPGCGNPQPFRHRSQPAFPQACFTDRSQSSAPDHASIVV